MILPFRAHLSTPDTVSVLSAAETTDEVSGLAPAGARATLDRLIAEGMLAPRPGRELYVAEIAGEGSVVTGVVAVVSSDHRVRPHERVLPDRVASLARYLEVLSAETVPVTLAHRRNQALAERIADATSEAPLIEAAVGEVSERLWALDGGGRPPRR